MVRHNGVFGKISIRICYEELEKAKINRKNVQVKLQEIISSLLARYDTSTEVEKKVIRRCLERLGGYLHFSWDKEKSEGVKYSRGVSYILVKNFISNYKDDYENK